MLTRCVKAYSSSGSVV